MKPWEQTWNDVKEVASEAASSVSAAMPWNRDWSSKQQEAPVQQQAPQQHTIETLFPKLIQAESRGQHIDAKTGKLTTSPVGAEGITQLMPKTAAKPGFGIEPVKDKSEGEYLRVGKEYLGKLLDKFGNDTEKALAAYNAGLGNVQKAVGQAERFGGEWKDYLPKKGETIPYINKILGKGEKSALNTPKNKMYEGTSGAQMLENVKATAYDVASLAPVTGELLSAKDAFEQAKKGEFSSAALSAIGAIPLVGSVGKAASRVGIAEHFFKVPFDSKTGYASVLNNPIHLKDGTRLSGFTDAGQTTFHGYDKNGERFTVRADKISPEDIISSKDSNKTAEYVKKQLSSSEPAVGYDLFSKLASKDSEALVRKMNPVYKYVGESETGDIYTLTHGSKTDVKFKEQDINFSSDGALGQGFYLTGDNKASKEYGKNVRTAVVGYKNPLVVTYENKDNIVEQIAANPQFWKENFVSRGAAAKWARQQKEDFAGIGDEDFLDMLKAAGFDGVVMKNKAGDVVEATVVNRSQLKFLDD